MGDPRKQRKKYTKSLHPWQATRIKEEKILLNEYGLKNKKEIWKSESLLRRFKSQAKRLIATKTEQSKKEEEQLIKRLAKLNILNEDSKLDDVLGLTLRNILDRRLQTIVSKKFSREIKQARQFVVHGHVLVNEKKITAPSYLVKKDENINFSSKSSLRDINHPERIILKKENIEAKEEVKVSS